MPVPLATGVHVCALRMGLLLEGDGVSVQISPMAVRSDKAISLRCGVCGIRG